MDMKWKRWGVGVLLVVIGLVIAGTVATVPGLVVALIGFLVMASTPLANFGGQ